MFEIRLSTFWNTKACIKYASKVAAGTGVNAYGFEEGRIEPPFIGQEGRLLK